MFWQMGQFEPSPIDSLLDRDDVTVTEVLDEDNLVQEVMHRNTKLISYLCKEETLKEMIELIVKDSAYEEVSLDDTDRYEDIQRRFKRANQVSELVNADSEEVGKSLVQSDDLLDLLMSILQNDEALNPLLASFFSKIFGGLLKHHPEQTWNYLKNKEDLMDDIIKHLATLGILDFILRLVTCPNENDQVRSEIVEWMVDEELVEKLISLLNSEQRRSTGVHTYAATCLSDLVRLGRDPGNGSDSSARCPLLNRLTQTSTIEKVIAQMILDPVDEAIFGSAASVLSTLLEPVQKMNFYPWEGESEKDVVSYYASATATVDVLANHVTRLHDILKQPPKLEPLKLPFGTLDPPLGKVRLFIVRLLSESIPQKSKSLFAAIKETSILQTIIALFFQFDNNSFLSGYFTTMVDEILQGEFDDDLIIRHLIDDCNLIDRLINAWFESGEAEAQGRPRKGHMGHIFKMIQLIEQLAIFQPKSESDSADPLSLGDSQNDRRTKFIEIRSKIINEKLEKMSETEETKWSSMKQEIRQVNEIQSRSLGKKKLNNLIQNDNQPTSAAEDSLARYQQKISADFMIELLHEDDLDDGDELPGLNNDEIADRDELSEGVSQATKENVFESLCATNNESIKDDIFDEYESSSSSDEENEKPSDKTKESTTKKEEDEDDLEKIENEKMDTSSPWPDNQSDNANQTPITTTFNAWVTPSEVETTNQGETGWASFDTADFGPPTGSSSPSQAKMETDHETKTQESGNGDNRSDSSKTS